METGFGGTSDAYLSASQQLRFHRGLPLCDRIKETYFVARTVPVDPNRLVRDVFYDSIYSGNSRLALAISGIQRIPLILSLEDATPKNQRRDKVLGLMANGKHSEEEKEEARGLRRDLVQILGERAYTQLRVEAKYVDAVIEEVLPLNGGE